MKANHKILYHCGENSSHRLLLVKHSRACDSWKSYVYNEATGEQLFASQERGIDQAERIAQLYALNHGVSPILSNRADFIEGKAVREITGDVGEMDAFGIDPAGVCFSAKGG